MNKHKSANKW